MIDISVIRNKAFVVGLVSVIAFSTVAIASVGHAAPINHGDFSDFGGGGTVTYSDVTEASVTDPLALPLYGAPSISVNTLDFDPTAGFHATSLGGAAPDLTDGQLNFGILAKLGTAIPWVDISESGVYTLAGTGTSVTSVTVATPIRIDILDVDEVPLAEKISLTFKFEQNYSLDVDAGTDVPWADSYVFDIHQALVDEGVGFVLGATKIDVVLDNDLLAFSETGTTAIILKGDVVIRTPDVPEPSALTLVGLGTLLWVGGRPARRRQRRPRDTRSSR